MRLDDKLEGLGLLSDDTIGRERRTLRARYQLVDSPAAKIAARCHRRIGRGDRRGQSEYATIAAEQTALENLVARGCRPDRHPAVAVKLRETPASAVKATQKDFKASPRARAASAQIFFFCGPDEAGAHAAAARSSRCCPIRASGSSSPGGDLRRDPVRLGDEARSTSLFGDTRHILVRASGDEAHDAVEILLDWREVEACPVLIVASGATDKSRTAKLLAARGPMRWSRCSIRPTCAR